MSAFANFRKIDVDLYDEDVLLDEELYDQDPRDPTQVLDDAKQKAAAVRTALSRYDHYMLSDIATLM